LVRTFEDLKYSVSESFKRFDNSVPGPVVRNVVADYIKHGKESALH